MKAFLRNPIKKKQHLLIFVDCLIVFAVLVISYVLRIIIWEEWSITSLTGRLSWSVFFVVLLHVFCFYIFQLYDIEAKRKRANLLLWIMVSVLMASGLISILSHIFPAYQLGRVLLSIYVPLLTTAIFVWRIIFPSVVLETRLKKNLLLIGPNSLVSETIGGLKNYTKTEYNIIGVFYDHKKKPSFTKLNGSQFNQALEQLVQEENIKTVVVAGRANEISSLEKQLLSLKFQGIDVFDYPTFYMNLTGKLPVFYISDAWVIFSGQNKTFKPPLYTNLKKILDVIFAVIGILLSIPLILITAIIIKLTSKGPIIYQQERVGLNKKKFILFKLRTMKDNAEVATGPVWAKENDGRVTMFGKILRKSRIDEIPQLLNVLKGDLSFIGPRPIRKCFEDESAKSIPFYEIRHVVQPGITGWAQVKNINPRNENGPLERLQYDLFYIQNQSLFLDAFIILKTIQTVLFKHGQ